MRAAWQFVVETLGDLPTEFVEDVVLVVSELATNSVIHAESPFTLRLEPDARSLRIELTDNASELPRKRSPDRDEPYGRGLHIVDSLAENWGVGLSSEGGKTIWVVVPLPVGADADVAASVNGLKADFDELIPSWLFIVRPVWLRAALGAAVPVVATPVLSALSDPTAGRPGTLLATILVAVACTSGWLAIAIAGAGSLLSYWYFAVPPIRSFALGGDATLSVAGMAFFVLSFVAVAKRVERAVEEVRILDRERQDQAETQADLRRTAERIAAQAESVLAVGSVLTSAHTLNDVNHTALNEINMPTAPTSASIAVVEANRLRVVASRGSPNEVVAQLERMDITRSAWLSAVLSGEPAYVEDRASSWRVVSIGVGSSDVRKRLVARRSVPCRSHAGPAGASFRGTAAAEGVPPGILARERAARQLAQRARSEEHQRRQHTQLELAFAERDRIARTLSTSLLPPALPRIAGFGVAAWLAPASGDEVAGDFYDLFAVDDGWVGVLGDVCGKGAEAAAVTSLARYASRAAVLENSDPAHIVRVANQALVAEPSELFCTAAVVRYLRSAGSVEVSLAGHLQARIGVPDGEVKRLGRFGAALGLGTEQPNVDRYVMPRAAMVGVVFRRPGRTRSRLRRERPGPLSRRPQGPRCTQAGSRAGALSPSCARSTRTTSPCSCSNETG